MVKTRIAPSPTGDPHIGTAYTALFNLAFARKNKGQFILRIEDTDRNRLVPGAEEKIINSLKWLGLEFDGDPIHQSERLSLYQKAAEELIKKKAAYYCNCTPERLSKLRDEQQKKGQVPAYDGKCFKNPPKEGPFVVRLRVPDEGETSVNDLIRGEVTFQNKDIDDAIILKSDGWPTYHLAVVVDDHELEITHVIRAEEWLSSTPKHVLLYQAFGYALPEFAHLPLLRNADRSKISKRKNPVSLDWYREQGYLPQALVNYLALMGWSMPDGREIFTLEEFTTKFDLTRVDPAGPVFDLKKLDWLNGEYIRKLTDSELGGRLSEYSKYSKEQIMGVISLVKERLKKLSEFDSLVSYFFEDSFEVKRDLIIQKGKDLAGSVLILEGVKEKLSQLKKWETEPILQSLEDEVGSSGWSKTEVFQTVRGSVTGSLTTPPLPETLSAIGREKVLARLGNVISQLKG
jgi:glutamyl-tRNA synthetase